MAARRLARGSTSASRRQTAESEILTLDPATLEYRPRSSPQSAVPRRGLDHRRHRERIATLFDGNDRVGAFLRETLAPTLAYTASVTPQIATSPDDVDRVMRWGFGWELGPFELMDAIGLAKVRDGDVPPAAPDLQLLKSARQRGSSGRTRAPASWTWATACCASSSTRR